MSRLVDQVWAALRRDCLLDVRYRIAFVLGLIDVMVTLVSYGYLAGLFGDRRPDGYAALPFLLVGLALTNSLTTAMVGLAMSVRAAQQAGTFKALLGLPLSPSRLMLVSMAYPALRATLDFVVLMAAALALGVDMSRAHLVAAVVVLALGVAAVCVIGVVSACCAVVFKRGDPVLWIMGTATWLLCGVLYPTSVLPAWLRPVSLLMPTTHAISAMRAAVIDGASWSAMATELTALALFVSFGLPLSLWAFDAAVAWARRSGTLGHA